MFEAFQSSWQVFIHTVQAGLQDWGSIHPAVVHLPIAALIIAPVFIVIGLVRPSSAKHYYTAALVMMLIGTLSIYLAVSTGESATEAIEPRPDIVETLEKHEHLAEDLRLNFSVLTSLFLVYLIFFGPLNNKFGQKIHCLILSLFLIVFAYNLILLFDTAHQGGKLVHHHGVTSKLYED